MRIVFVADVHIHIGKEMDWEYNRLLQLADKIVEQKADKVVLLGDTFEFPRPNLETEKAFYDFVTIISKDAEVLVVDGNHEELGECKTTYDYLPQLGFKYYKNPTCLPLNSTTDLWLVGHSRLDYLKHIKKDIKASKNILASHIRCAVGKMVKAEVDFSNFVKLFDNIILGDIHTRMFPYPNTEYVSQPYRTNYTTPSDCGILCLDVEAKSYKISYIPLQLPSKNLVEVSVDDLENTLKGLSKTDLYKVRVVGTLEELSKLPKVASNIRLEPIVIQENINREEIVKEFVASGKINITETLIKLAGRVDNLSEETLGIGESMLSEIVKEYYK